MSVFLGSNQIGSINLIQLQNINTDIEDALINKTIQTYANSEIYNIRPYAFYDCESLTSIDLSQATTIGTYAFYSCYSLTSANFPNCISIGSYAFNSCRTLTTASFPNCSYIETQAFTYCSNLTTINFSNCSYIGNYAFRRCSSLTLISLPNCSYIGTSAFDRCYNLLSLYLLGSSIPTLANINAFVSTPISDYTTSTGGVYGSIYVPASLYNSYLTATNWSVYSARIVSV